MTRVRPVLAVVALLPAAFLLTILGGHWLSPGTQHAATGLGWARFWQAFAVITVGLVVWLIIEGARRGRPLALAGRILLATVALIAVWSARFESYGPISSSYEQTYVWPFGDGPVRR